MKSAGASPSRTSSNNARGVGRNGHPKLIYYNKVHKGGHFAAWEQPQLFCRDASRVPIAGRLIEPTIPLQRLRPKPTRKGTRHD